MSGAQGYSCSQSYSCSGCRCRGAQYRDVDTVTVSHTTRATTHAHMQQSCSPNKRTGAVLLRHPRLEVGLAPAPELCRRGTIFIHNIRYVKWRPRGHHGLRPWRLPRWCAVVRESAQSILMIVRPGPHPVTVRLSVTKLTHSICDCQSLCTCFNVTIADRTPRNRCGSRYYVLDSQI